MTRNVTRPKERPKDNSKACQGDEDTRILDGEISG